MLSFHFGTMDMLKTLSRFIDHSLFTNLGPSSVYLKFCVRLFYEMNFGKAW